MSYVFKEKITYDEYLNFIKEQKYLSFMQEDLWAKTKKISNHKIVAVKENDKVCALASILVKKRKGKKYFYIPNGYLMDFTNKELLEFMTSSIKMLARMYGAYAVEVYPNIDVDDPICTEVHNNFRNLNYKFKDEYIDKTNNLLIPLKKKNKKISKTELKKKYENKDFYISRGIEFEVTNNKEDIRRLQSLVTGKYFDFETIDGLITNFKDRVHMIFAKLDLVFYKNYLIENTNDAREINKVEELLTISDAIDIGCAIIIEPLNDKDNICEFLYNTEKESFTDLDITNGLLYETMKICNSKGYSFIKISNFNLNINKYIERYNAHEIKYIGHYSLVLKKFTYFLNRELNFKS